MTGLEPVPVPVDRSGLDPTMLPVNVAGVPIAPAHSYPNGATLAADRRRERIAWAGRTNAIVIGCATKTVSPALRLGWMSAPADLIGSLEREKHYDDMGSNLLDQLAFARFVDSGDFSRYPRRVRPTYRRRRDTTLQALREYLPEARPQGEAAGLHLPVLLPEDVNELALAAAAYADGVLVEDGAWH